MMLIYFVVCGYVAVCLILYWLLVGCWFDCEFVASLTGIMVLIAVFVLGSVLYVLFVILWYCGFVALVVFACFLVVILRLSLGWFI